MATEAAYYLTFAEAVTLHLMLVRRVGETRYGTFDRALLDSALARPRHAALYEGADLVRQAATLCLGLLKNHPGSGAINGPRRSWLTVSSTATASKSARPSRKGSRWF